MCSLPNIYYLPCTFKDISIISTGFVFIFFSLLQNWRHLPLILMDYHVMYILDTKTQLLILFLEETLSIHFHALQYLNWPFVIIKNAHYRTSKPYTASFKRISSTFDLLIYECHKCFNNYTPYLDIDDRSPSEQCVNLSFQPYSTGIYEYLYD